MTQQHYLKRPLVLAFGSLLLLLAIPHEAYAQESVKAGRRAPLEVPESLKQPVKGDMGAASRQQADGEDPDPFPEPGVHGFFMFGKDNVMLYHSSVFRSNNHPYQMIIRASLSPTSAADFYRDNYYEQLDLGWMWIAHNAEWDASDTMVSSTPFILPSIQAGTVTSFNGEISLTARDGSGYPATGHDYLSNVTFTLDRVMYFRHYDLSAAYPDELTYLIFGIGDEDVYMAHYLTKRGDGSTPDPLAFDDIVRIKRPWWLADDDDLLESVIEVKVLGLSTITSLPRSSPMVLGEPIHVRVYGDTSRDGQPFYVEVLDEVWFDTKTINQ